MARKAWKKKIYFNLIGRQTLRAAAAIHAITNAEKDHCKQLQTCSYIRVIPNGVDIDPPLSNQWMKRYLPHEVALIPSQNPVLLFLGRLHPKKGLDILIPAFTQLLQRHPEAWLVLAGPDPVGYRQALIELAHSHQVQNRVLFPGMVTGLHKRTLLQRADLFALPSYSEGFSVAVLEALAAAKPVVISKNCYFNEVLSVGCGRVVDNSVSQFAQALSDLLDLDSPTRAIIGQRGRELVEQVYTWPSIARQMCNLYQEVLSTAAATSPHPCDARSNLM
jgi:glycosyltransferase involved in cell wall biosynthesis